MNLLKDVIEIPIYASNELTGEDFFKSNLSEIKEQYPFFRFESVEQIVKLSNYNKIASSYGIDEYDLNDEYIVICDFNGMIARRNRVLEICNILQIAGKEYKSKYNECKSGYILMPTIHTNTGIIIVPDNSPLKEEMKEHKLRGNS